MKPANYGPTEMSIGNICELVNGRAFKPSEWTSKGLPIVRIQNLNDETKPFNYFDGVYSPRHEVNNGDLLFSWSGTPGTSFGAFFWNRGKGVLNQHIFNVIVDKKQIDLRYLRYALNHRLNRIIIQAHGGVGLQHITKDKLEAVTIPLPPLPEQRRIADILDKADAIRRKRREALRLAQKIREASFVDMFGDPRWPNQTWTNVSMSEVAEIDAPMVDPKEEQYQNLIHIGPDRIEKETGNLLPAMTAAEERLISGKFLFDERYVLYSKIRPYLRKVAMPDFKGLCSADVYPVRPKPELATREYLFSLLISEAFFAYTQSLASRASIPKLNREEFGKYRFPLPNLQLQEQFTLIVNKQIVCNKRLSNAAQQCENLFNSLVQRAFRGEL